MERSMIDEFGPRSGENDLLFVEKFDIIFLDDLIIW